MLDNIRTALALGLPNILRVVIYRLGLRLRCHPVTRLSAPAIQGPFFEAARAPLTELPAVTNWQSAGKLFSRWPVRCTQIPPNWLCNPLTGVRFPDAQRPWWRIPDFDARAGDIKVIWELSRFDWVLAFAQRTQRGDHAALEQLNTWLADWCQHNLPYLGPNWKCGQEASLRVLNLACAALVLQQSAGDALASLKTLLITHLQRIAPTVSYAMAQDNNHGTSEAAALFVGGIWLDRLGEARGKRWAKRGRTLLENRVRRLITQDGTFSQYSLNYHRMMLDTLSFTQLWCIRMAEPAFSKVFLQRARAATRWLYELIDPSCGDGPNIGANDGARLLQLADTDYRDYRPTVQLAAALFMHQRAYAAVGAWDVPCRWLGIDTDLPAAPPRQGLWADDGGFAILRRNEAMAVLRYPRFRFRPNQADALHLDLWVNGLNLLRDAGSYSYNAQPDWTAYFMGTQSHNTIQFDKRDQMPKLGRFLFAAWLKAKNVSYLADDSKAQYQARAAYRDRWSANHDRSLTLEPGLLAVQDRLSGARSAVLRWRLYSDAWQIDTVTDSQRTRYRIHNPQGHSVTLCASTPVVRCEIVQGYESLYYLEKTPIPVIEIEFSIKDKVQIWTEYRWQ